MREWIGNKFARKKGETKPAVTAYNGAVKACQFKASDESHLTFHIPHDYVAGTEIFLHIHWSHIGAFVTGGTITFRATSV